MREDVKDLDKKTQEKNFWDDSQNAQKLMAKLSSYKRKLEKFDKLALDIEELEVLLQIIEEEDDEEEYQNFKTQLNTVVEAANNLNTETLLSGEYDDSNAILSIHAGAGGTEAQDWADILYRMFRRYADRLGFKFETLDLLQEDEAGIKSATMLIKGENAYGLLKSEKGVHRLVRISPFDAAKKRHTSFASVDVYPDFDDDIEVEIKPEDIRVDTFRSGGAGGQHVNTTDSAVRITHIPTGIVVSCQNERSQIQNRDVAMKMLKAKLIALKEEEQKEKIEDLQGNYSQIAWGSQIRSYVFNPYQMVKDHRTDVEVGDIESVIDGDIDIFVNAYLELQAGKNKREE